MIDRRYPDADAETDRTGVVGGGAVPASGKPPCRTPGRRCSAPLRNLSSWLAQGVGLGADRRPPGGVDGVGWSRTRGGPRIVSRVVPPNPLRGGRARAGPPPGEPCNRPERSMEDKLLQPARTRTPWRDG